MTLRLRQRHRRIFAILGVVLPLTLALGIIARRTVPQAEGFHPELSPEAVTFTATGFERDDLFTKSQIRVRLFRDLGSGTLAVGLSAAKEFLKPDLLVYWVTGTPTKIETLPGEAKLLGAFVNTTLVLPDEASTTNGCLILYSLANQEIVDVSKPFVAERGSPTRSASAVAAVTEQSDGPPQSPTLRLSEPRSN